jgi:threonine dehydratase
MIPLRAIERARETVADAVLSTPLVRFDGPEVPADTEIWLKLECLQPIGSFKLRGALNALLLLSEAERDTGVLTVSAGNHGLGVARAAAILDLKATVIVPQAASTAKVEALRRSGAELLLHGATYDEAEAYGRQLARDRGVVFVSAYNDEAVVAGGGTIALEVLEDLPATQAFVVPAGGGGLIGGIGVAAHGLDPTTVVFGVQAENSPAIHAAHQAGRYVEVAVSDTLADGLSGNIESDSITIDLLREHVRSVALVSEADIALAMRSLLETEHILVEGSAAVGVAAIQRGLLALDGPTVVVLTGRNVSASVLRQYVFDADLRISRV